MIHGADHVIIPWRHLRFFHQYVYAVSACKLHNNAALGVLSCHLHEVPVLSYVTGGHECVMEKKKKQNSLELLILHPWFLQDNTHDR